MIFCRYNDKSEFSLGAQEALLFVSCCDRVANYPAMPMILKKIIIKMVFMYKLTVSPYF